MQTDRSAEITGLLVPGSGALHFGAAHVADPLGRRRLEQAGVGGFPGELAEGREPLVESFAWLTSPGLYLVRITVPANLALGPQVIQVSTGASKTPSSLMLMVGAAS